ncbi:MAG: type II toxin-antitoxin system RelE/ParE family toxin [Verrucomicrobiota bacterium]
MKSKPIEYHPDALLEVMEVFEWYEQCEEGLGARFHQELSKAEKLVKKFPSLGTPKGYGTRKRTLSVFPYSLIYTDEPDYIAIIALAHHAREPEYWLQRLSE